MKLEDVIINVIEEYNKKLNCEKPKIAPNKKHIFHLYVIRNKKRDELIEYLKSKEIVTKKLPLINLVYPVNLV